jgi:mono/diheme cytochrome c family protein
MLGKFPWTPVFFRCALAPLAVALLPAASFAADATNGKIISKRWCSACHLVSADQKTASADVPGFAAIARKKLPQEQLRAFLMDPHPKMPDMNLTRSEIEDIVAYIRSLNR